MTSHVFFVAGAILCGSTSNTSYPHLGPLFITALRLKDGALIASSTQAPRPTGHEGRAAPPNSDLMECPFSRGEWREGAGRAGLGHRVRP